MLASRQKSSMSPRKPRKEHAHDLPTHSEDGVDLTLIRWMLSLTPAERLRVLQTHVQSIEKLRRGKIDT